MPNPKSAIPDLEVTLAIEKLQQLHNEVYRVFDFDDWAQTAHTAEIVAQLTNAAAMTYLAVVLSKIKS